VEKELSSFILQVIGFIKGIPQLGHTVSLPVVCIIDYKTFQSLPEIPVTSCMGHSVSDSHPAPLASSGVVTTFLFLFLSKNRFRD
jgi:hypothetical protein